MASNYSANQFEPEFSPSRLRNWEIPKWYRGRPLQRTSATKIISDDRGHLLPGVNRSKTSPWTNFKGTWQLPKRITKEDALNLRTPLIGTNRWNTLTKDGKINKEQYQLERARFQKKLVENLDYVPGNLTSPSRTHHTQDYLIEQKKNEIAGVEKEIVLNPLYTENNVCMDNADVLIERQNKRHEKVEPNFTEDSEKIPNTTLNEKMRQEITDKPGESNTVPLIPAYCNFETARRMAQENLEHQPLPDSIMDRAYRKLQAKGVRNPELALDVFPTATGVGVRTHNAGPTHCTKLKVYRPKTCGVVPKPLYQEKNSARPFTAAIENMRPMDLAICWDYRPANPNDEPKPPTHIDGSNGSAAPAVFNLVKTPRSVQNELGTGRSGGVFSNTLGDEGFFEKDVMLRNKNYFSARLNENTVRECKCAETPGSGNQKNKLLESRTRCKSSPNLSILAHASDSSDIPNKENIIVCNYNQEHYHVRPICHSNKHRDRPFRNQSLDKAKPNRIRRLCDEQRNSIPNSDPIQLHKSEPTPFRAGVPRSNSSGICNSFDSGCSSISNGSASSKVIKIPKPRNPYAKKGYVIDTLAPPFACWKGGAGQGGYPEHWRLASVYQHAYKPVEQRKRPLLATVFQ